MYVYGSFFPVKEFLRYKNVEIRRRKCFVMEDHCREWPYVDQGGKTTDELEGTHLDSVK